MTETSTLHHDIRRMLDLLETLLDTAHPPIADPLETMLADLHAIRESLAECATAMQYTRDAVVNLTETLDKPR